MFSRLDAIVFAAWLFTGALMVENHHRVNLTQTDPELKQAKVATRCHAASTRLPDAFSAATSAAPAAFVQLPAPGCTQP